MKQSLITCEYDPIEGRQIRSKFNWMEWIRASYQIPLKKVNKVLVVKDIQHGPHQLPITWNNQDPMKSLVYTLRSLSYCEMSHLFQDLAEEHPAAVSP